MSIKYNDTIEGWKERGYKVTSAAILQAPDKTMINREGKRLFSWGQVVPSTYRDASYYDNDLVDDDWRLDAGDH